MVTYLSFFNRTVFYTPSHSVIYFLAIINIHSRYSFRICKEQNEMVKIYKNARFWVHEILTAGMMSNNNFLFSRYSRTPAKSGSREWARGVRKRYFPYMMPLRSNAYIGKCTYRRISEKHCLVSVCLYKPKRCKMEEIHLSFRACKL